MYTAAKLGIATILTLLIVALIAPLAIFFVEMLSNPQEFLTLTPVSIKELSDGKHVNITLKLVYRGTIPLKDLKATFHGVEFTLPVLRKGTYMLSSVAESSKMKKNGLSATLIFSLEGLYPIRIQVSGGSHG
jgi:uncharacterized protein (DUF58 family)